MAVFSRKGGTSFHCFSTRRSPRSPPELVQGPCYFRRGVPDFDRETSYVESALVCGHMSQKSVEREVAHCGTIIKVPSNKLLHNLLSGARQFETPHPNSG